MIWKLHIWSCATWPKGLRQGYLQVAFPNPPDAPDPAEPGFGSASQDNSRGAGAARLSNAELRARYAAVEEVALVEVSGREPEEILIRYRASEVTRNERFGAAAIAQTLRDFSRSLAVRVSGGVSLVVDGRYDSVSKVAQTPVDNIHSIGGLAQVQSQPRRAERVTQLNGSRGTLVYVMATADADLIRLSGELRELGRSLVKELDRPLEPLVLYDLGTELRVTLFALMGQVVLGTGAVMVLMVLFLRAGKDTWVIFPAVGFACLTPVALLSVVGFSLDGTVFGAVALAAGLAADGAAVVLEFELQSFYGSGSRNIGRHHIWTQPYTAALFFSFLSTVVVFLPLYYAGPAFREAYASFALALCSGLAAATLYTTWIMPQLLRSSYKEHTAATETPLFSRALL
ncbi:MAG: efflux RND transporter permease subunit, partial [Spirochaeta sp.]|nr:efflux RND transporter permease subunit [Spirochaeta sp.]